MAFTEQNGASVRRRRRAAVRKLLARINPTNASFAPGFTSTRVGEGATYIDNNGIVKVAPVNYLLQSNSLAAGWTKRGTAGVAGKADPFGGLLATEYVIGLPAVEDLFQNTGGLVNSGAYWASLWIRVVVVGAGALRLANPQGAPVTALATPTVGVWTRVGADATASAGGASGLWLQASGAGWTVQVYGGQLEPGTAATTYIPTAATSMGAQRCNHYIAGTQTCLYEGARTNLCLQSGSLATAPWQANSANVTAAAAAAIGPDGTLSATRITWAAPSLATDAWFQPIAVPGGTANKQIVVSGWLKSEGGNVALQLQNSQAGVVDTYSVLLIGAVWTFVQFALTNGAGAGTGNQNIGIANAVAAGGRSILAWGFQVENALIASSYIPTLAAAVTRNADKPLINWPYSLTPTTFYIKYYDLGTYATVNARAFQVGNNGNPNASVMGSSDGVNYAGQFKNSAGAFRTSGLAVALAMNNLIELRVQQTDDLAVIAGITVNGSAETIGAKSVTSPGEVAYNDPRLALNGDTGFNNVGFMALVVFKAAKGNQPLSFMRAA